MPKKPALLATALARAALAKAPAEVRRVLFSQGIAHSTLRAYESSKRKLQDILGEMGLELMTKDAFLCILGALNDAGAGLSTADAWRSAILFFQQRDGWDLAAGEPPWADEPDLRRATAGYRYRAKDRVRETGVIDHEVAERMCALWGPSPFVAMLRVQLATGTRVSELVDLRVNCLRERGDGELAVFLRSVKNPKNRESPGEVKDVLVGHEECVRTAVETARAAGRTEADFLFCPQAQSKRAYSAAVKCAAATLGLPPELCWSSHAARHGAANEVRQRLAREDEGARVMGMSTSVYKQYARPVEAREKRVRARKS